MGPIPPLRFCLAPVLDSLLHFLAAGAGFDLQPGPGLNFHLALFLRAFTPSPARPIAKTTTVPGSGTAVPFTCHAR